MSDKICLPTEHYFLLMVCFLLITMYYVYNLKNMHNIDFNYGLNNNLATLSEHVRRLDTIPLIQNKQPIKKPLRRKMSKEDALRVLTNENTRITSNNLTDLQTEVLEDYPELVLDTQPRSLMTENITKDSLLERQVLTNELPSKQLESPLAVPDIQKRVALENRDQQAVFNDFRAPERRDPEHA